VVNGLLKHEQQCWWNLSLLLEMGSLRLLLEEVGGLLVSVEEYELLIYFLPKEQKKEYIYIEGNK